MPEVSFVGSKALMARGMAAVRPAVVESAEAMSGQVNIRPTPRDTGTLLGSVHVSEVNVSGSEVTATVSTGGEASEYAFYVEGGTSKMAAQPYMAPALLEHEPVHKQMVEQAWKAAF